MLISKIFILKKHFNAKSVTRVKRTGSSMNVLSLYFKNMQFLWRYRAKKRLDNGDNCNFHNLFVSICKVEPFFDNFY